MTARFPDLRAFDLQVSSQVVSDVKYSGYIDRQQIEVERQNRLGAKRIPDSFDYDKIRQLRTEAREKLTKIRPTSLAQASRISGITPSDIALLMTHMEGGRQ